MSRSFLTILLHHLCIDRDEHEHEQVCELVGAGRGGHQYEEDECFESDSKAESVNCVDGPRAVGHVTGAADRAGASLPPLTDPPATASGVQEMGRAPPPTYLPTHTSAAITATTFPHPHSVGACTLRLLLLPTPLPARALLPSQIAALLPCLL